uniref:Uncharacterized protein n=1 Tax=Chenopodium quinoa TaxID=63459 RepID=A0A803MS47_CHEQI
MAKRTKKKPDPPKDIASPKKAAANKKVTAAKKTPAPKKSPASKKSPTTKKVPASTNQSPIKGTKKRVKSELKDSNYEPEEDQNENSDGSSEEDIKKGKEIKKTHCRPNAVVDLIKDFSEQQKKDVISIGFGGLLQLKLTRISTKMLPWICHHFNESSCMFKIDMLKEFHTFLAPVANRVIDYKIINYTDNVKEIHNLDWCGYVMNNLCKSVRSFKNNKNKDSRSGISGCVLILQLVYFHHLAFRDKGEKDSDNQEDDADNKDVVTDNQGVDPDITNVVHSVTESVLNQATLTKEATQKPIEVFAEKQLQEETTTIEYKDIHKEIVSKVKISLDCGEKDVVIDFVSKTMKGNKSRMNEMPDLYQVVADYCIVKYSPFKHEKIVKFEGPLMITRDDTTSLAPTAPAQMIKSNIVQCWSFLMNDSRLIEDPSCFFFGIDHSRPLELSLWSQDASQPTDKTEVKSASVHSQELNQAWYDWMCLRDAKEKIITAQLVEEMSNFLKRINHEKADEILEYGFDEVNFKWKTPRYTLLIHMLCFSGETFDSDLDLANRRKVYRAEICVALALADINTKRKQLEKKISRFRVVRKLEKEKGVEDMICVSNFLKKHKDVMDNMSLQCHQVIDYLAINDGENFPNKSEVVCWFIDSIEIVRQDCNAFLNEWKVSSNVITAWSNHLNNIEMERDRSENDLVRYFFGFDFMVYDGANGIGLGTITEEFARLNHHHVVTVLDLLLSEKNQMKQILLTNFEDWEKKKEYEEMLQ